MELRINRVRINRARPVYHHRRREDLCTCSLASIYLGILYEKNMLKACSIGLCKGGKCLAMGFETFVKDSVNYFASGQDSLEIMSLLCFLSFLTIQFRFLQNNINQMQNTKGRPRPVT